MALFGAIDEVVSKTNDLDTVRLVESFLPGTTAPGRRGWYAELQRFLGSPELDPLDDDDNVVARKGGDLFPGVSGAMADLTEEQPVRPVRPAVMARSLYAATVLAKVAEHQGDDQMPDPVHTLLPRAVAEGTEDPGALRDAFVNVGSRKEYRDLVATLAEKNALHTEIATSPISCTGSLRKLDGGFCSVLTTDWIRPNLTVEDMKKVIDPHNWPKLAPGFFVAIKDQNPPTDGKGWTRVMEVVSADPEQWQMRTALRYWKGTTPDGGIYVNYDLDADRTGDSGVVEVDAGYLLITPIKPGDNASGVRVRTCKQVRIRGISPTATAALSCFFGWGDAASHMLGDDAANPPPDLVPFGKPSSPDDASPAPPPQAAVDEESEEAVDEAAEKVEMPPGWRGLLIENVRKEANEFVGVAAEAGGDLYRRWSDGMDVKDVREFGEQFGRQMTDFTVRMFNAAAAAIRPAPETKGDDQ
jgi:hypothetical protein